MRRRQGEKEEEKTVVARIRASGASFRISVTGMRAELMRYRNYSQVLLQHVLQCYAGTWTCLWRIPVAEFCCWWDLALSKSTTTPGVEDIS